MSDYSKYFNLRNINSDYYLDYRIPKYIEKILPNDKNADILDIGCGFGSFIRELKKLSYNSVHGIDSSDQAIEFCLKQHYSVTHSNVMDYTSRTRQKFDFITMSHVLEHLNKNEIIETLSAIKSSLLKDGGKLCLMVPNAQSNTGSYWAYEDFTHNTLFTSGSLMYVLKAAGFAKIEFLDPNGTDNSTLLTKIIKIIFLPVYRIKKKFWNRITSSSFHEKSPEIFTFELKVLAY